MTTARKLGLSVALFVLSFPLIRLSSWFALGVPVGRVLSVLYGFDLAREVREGPSPGRRMRVVAMLMGVPQALLGLACAAIGVATVAWVLYNSFIARRPEYPGGFLTFGIGPVLILFGAAWVAAAFRLSPARGPRPRRGDDMVRSLALIVCCLLAVGASAQGTPPRVLVDRGACPFECCRYGPWVAGREIPAFASAGAARPTLTLRTDQPVTALTGYVRTVGQTFVVQQPHGRYRPGDTLTVYSYYGEGQFAVWYHGERLTEDLGFSPYGGTGGTRCTDRVHCWGTLDGDLRPDWWVELRLDDGRIVWARGDAGFEGQDACG